MSNIKKINLNGTNYDITDAVVRSSVANEYSSTATYDVGDYCIKDGIVYKCTSEIASPGETWNSSHWTEVKIMDELENTQGGSVASANKLTTARGIEGVKFDGTAAIIHFGTDTVAAATAAHTASITDFELANGARVIVKFTNGVAVANPTLNVTNTGAKAIYYRGTKLTATNNIGAGDVVELVYDSTLGSNAGGWHIVGTLRGALDKSSVTVGASKTLASISQTDGVIAVGTPVDIAIGRSQVTDLASLLVYYGTCGDSALSAIKNVTVENGFTLTAGAKVRVKFTDGNATVPTLNVNDTGAKSIKWKGAMHTVGAPDYSWQAGSVMDFVYDGDSYCVVDNGLANTVVTYSANSEALNITSYNS